MIHDYVVLRNPFTPQLCRWLLDSLVYSWILSIRTVRCECSIESLCAEIVAFCAGIHRVDCRQPYLIEKLDAAKPWRHAAMPS